MSSCCDVCVCVCVCVCARTRVRAHCVHCVHVYVLASVCDVCIPPCVAFCCVPSLAPRGPEAVFLQQAEETIRGMIQVASKASAAEG